MRSLTLLVHGEAGSGKSWLGNTAPGPRLLLDSEKRSEYLSDLRADPTGMTPQDRVLWDPRNPIPEESKDPNKVTVVVARTYEDVDLAVRHLISGNHPFRSVVLDSLQETQELLIHGIAGLDQMKIADWGEALRKLGSMLRTLCDLRAHPSNPLSAIVVLSGTQERDGLKRPAIQGQLAGKVAYLFDVVGFQRKGVNAEQERVIYLTIDGYSDGSFVTKCNIHPLAVHYGEHVVFPNIEDMLSVLNPVSDSTDNNDKDIA